MTVARVQPANPLGKSQGDVAAALREQQDTCELSQELAGHLDQRRHRAVPRHHCEHAHRSRETGSQVGCTEGRGTSEAQKREKSGAQVIHFDLCGCPRQLPNRPTISNRVMLDASGQWDTPDQTATKAFDNRARHVRPDRFISPPLSTPSAHPVMASSNGRRPAHQCRSAPASRSLAHR